MKEYAREDLIIGWEPEKCIHAGVCARTLPAVYTPKQRPWIHPDNATKDELMAQIDACPSGALSYREPNKLQVVFHSNDTRGNWRIMAGPSIQAGMMTFVWDEQGHIVINHTEVAPEFQGQGVAGQLLEAAVAYARANNRLIVPVCPYVLGQFEKRQELADLRA